MMRNFWELERESCTRRLALTEDLRQQRALGHTLTLSPTEALLEPRRALILLTNQWLTHIRTLDFQPIFSYNSCVGSTVCDLAVLRPNLLGASGEITIPRPPIT